LLNAFKETTPMSEPSAEPTVLYQQDGAVAVLTLNRPAALNSFTRQMHHALWAALDRVQANLAIRALVLTGAGRGFCAGADLSEFDLSAGPDMARRADPGPIIEQAFNPTTRRLINARVPTVCAVNGVAAGAGASVAMACDIAIAAPGASFIQAFSKIGLAPDSGATWLLPQRVGLARALALAFTGDKLSAQDAKAMGMIWDVQGDPLAAATALAQRLAAMPTQALVATRHLLRGAHTHSLDEQLDLERDVQSRLGHTHDYIEGVMAFLQKRPARFKGE
jgi:2-(1,2-epoxy-1,2-dihydrophenyl)acetyl-CoA isomerase